MKRFLAILLAAIMLLALVSCSNETSLIEDDEIVVSDNKITNNDGLGYFTYEVNRDGHYSITGYTTVSSEKHAIEIPQAIDEITVTGIATEAFKSCTNLTAVTIPSSVTFIEDLAFYGCDGLTTITIPESVTEIGTGAFRECTALKTIELPDGLTEYADELFWGCTVLEVEISDKVTSIGAGAFYDCDALASVTIGNNVTSVGDAAFYSCDALTDIIISNTNEDFLVGDAAFAGIGADKVTFTVADGSAFAQYFDTYFAPNTNDYGHYEIVVG